MQGFPKLRGTGEDETSRMLVIDLRECACAHTHTHRHTHCS
jgi:hypothetical protein